MLVIGATLNIMKLSLFKQKMEYTTYVACRAAVVSLNQKDANKYAKDLTRINLNPYSKIIQKSEPKISFLTDYVKPPQSGTGEAGTDSRSASQSKANKKGKWVKGHFVRLTLSVDLKKSNFIINGQNKKTSVAMAIEKEDY